MNLTTGRRITNKEKYLEFEFVKDYDKTISAFVPPYINMINTIVNAIQFDAKEQIKAIEFGHGTGMLTTKFLDQFPNSKVVGIDISPHMSKMAKKKLSRFKDRFCDIVADATIHSLEDYYDLFLSNLFLHELNENERTKIIMSIFTHLKDNGLFVFGDYIPQKEKQIKEYLVEQWKQNMIKNGVPMKIAELEIAMHIDERWSEKEYFLSLQRAGFNSFECIWKDGFYAIIIAYKNTNI